MSAAETIASLTEQHRQAQVTLGSTAIQDWMLLWSLWNGDAQTFAQLVQASVPLVQSYRDISASLGGAYYQTARATERVSGEPTVKLADPIDVKQITSSLYVTGEVMTRNALAAGQSAEEARRNALVRTSGAVSRLALDGGRSTIVNSIDADNQAVGWARITDGDPCAFCLMLASRGAVYKSEQSASFQAHDHCGCTAMPLWDGTSLPDATQKWKDVYNAAQRQGVENGDLKRGRNSSTDRLNAVRRYLASQSNV